MKTYQKMGKCAVSLFTLAVLSVTSKAQSKSPIKKDTVYSTIGINPVIKD